VKATGATTTTLDGAAMSDQSAPTDQTSSGAAMTRPVAPPPDPQAAERRREVAGLFLIGLGALFLLGNAGLFRLVRWDLAWPLVFIAIGALLLAQRVRR
jgi:hypothetical protein